MNLSVSGQVLHSNHEIACPGCDYPIWVLWSELVAQGTIRCPCCRVMVRLVDQDGRAQTLGADLERQLDQALKGLFR